jgi:hypothetical protein
MASFRPVRNGKVVCSSRRPDLKPINPAKEQNLQRDPDEQIARSNAVSAERHTPDRRVNIGREDDDPE